MDIRDLLIRTLIGEARSEGDTGMAGVAHVIRNRMSRMRKPVDEVILAPAQFSLWNRGNPAGLSAMGVSKDDPLYIRAGQIADGVFAGTVPDVTGGATHYYNPALAAPEWGAQLKGAQQIGNHRFGQAPMAGIEPEEAPAPRNPLVQPVSYTPPYGPSLTPPLHSLPPDYIAPQRNPVTGPPPPASTDELGNSLDEYFEGRARRAPGVDTDPVYEMNLLRFLNDNPYGIAVTSYQRDAAQQKALWDAKLLENGGDVSLTRKWVAPPGRSFHGKGMAADLSYENNQAREWAHQNAGKYTMAFPLANEPWHVEPAGARSGGGAGTAMNAFNPGNTTMPATGAPDANGFSPMAPPGYEPRASPIATAMSGLAQTLSQPTQQSPQPKPHDMGAGQPDFAQMLATLAVPPRAPSAGTALPTATPPAAAQQRDPAFGGDMVPVAPNLFQTPQIGQQADPLADFRRALAVGRASG